MNDKMSTVTLSICIPTYNRSECLRDCLTSVVASIAGHERDIEIVISNNASTDNTEKVIHEFKEAHPSIRYHRNAQNIGGERNFRHVATLAQGENLWIFGDDDKMEANAVSIVLNHIRAGYGLIICNYTLWDQQFSHLRKKTCGLAGKEDQIFEDANELMKRFGLHLGYISSVVIRRSFFLEASAQEYEVFVEYGFPYVYALYAGAVNPACKAYFIAAPLVRNRGGNTGNYDWYKYFIVGSSLIFDKLQSKGYTKSATVSAKHQVLKDFVIPNMVSRKVFNNNNKINMDIISRHYKKDWLFWAACIPIFFSPRFLLRFAKKMLIFSGRLNRDSI